MMGEEGSLVAEIAPAGIAASQRGEGGEIVCLTPARYNHGYLNGLVPAGLGQTGQVPSTANLWALDDVCAVGEHRQTIRQ